MKKTTLLSILLIFLLPVLRAGETAEQGKAPEAEKPKPKVARTFIELGLELSISAANYWKKYTKFIEDWQFELNWRDQKRKFFTSEGLRLDSNNMRLNWTHAWAGGIYYSWARSNRLSPFASFLFSAGGSLVWEYIAEWREISSINDHVFTWSGGPAIAEPLFQIGEHFRRRRGLANRIACLLVNPPLAINDFLDGKNRPPRVPVPDQADFRIAFGGKRGPASPADNAPGHAEARLDLRLVTLPGYGLPGSGAGYYRRAIESCYGGAISFNSDLVEEFAVHTRCVLGGWWRRDLRAAEDGGLHGSEWWLGPVMGWDLFQKKPIVPYDGDDLGMTMPWMPRESPTRFTDKQSSVHLLGPAFSLTRWAGRLAARLDLEATLDFSMIHALAYNDYSADHDVWGVKTTLHNWGYYYSLGTSLAGGLDLRFRGLRAEAGVRYQRFRSIQGLDRFQKDLLDDSPVRDSRFTYSAALSAAIPRTPLFLSLALEGIDRWGRFHEVSARSHELRFFYRLGVSL